MADAEHIPWTGEAPVPVAEVGAIAEGASADSVPDPGTASGTGEAFDAAGFNGVTTGLPTFAVRIDWNANGSFADGFDDVTEHVTHLTYTRGASFDGSSEAPGSCTITLHNDDGRYTPTNTASPLSGWVKPGRRVWIVATWQAATHALFYGTVRRVVLNTSDKTAELVCEDPLYDLSRVETSVVLSQSRSLTDFRGAILDDAGLTAAQRDLAEGVENNVPITFADQANALTVLAEINTATGSFHFIRPSTSAATLFEYVTVDRATLQSDANVAEEWTHAKVIGADGFDLSDDTIINYQRVRPGAKTVAATTSEVAAFDGVPFTVPAGDTRELWLTYGAWALDAAAVYDASGDVTVSFDSFGNTGRVSFEAGASDVTVSTLTISAQAIEDAETTSVVVDDTASINTYGPRAGSEISSPYIVAPTAAEGLGSWIVLRYADPRVRPSIVRENDFPLALVTEVGDRVSFTFAEAHLSESEFFIRSHSHVIAPAVGLWTSTYFLEAAPTALSLFTIGGTADQGVGGTAILGY